jgi:hypothetical protein
MPTPEAAQEHYRTLQRLQVVLVGAGRRAWARMGSEFDRSWLAIAPGLLTVTAATQLAAARAATQYVPAVLEEQGTPVDPLVRVRPEAFAGRASDGRSLAGLLYGAVSTSRVGMKRGLDGGDALEQGQRWLESALRTVVTDAARDAIQAEVVARPTVQYVRVINPPCCSRCAVLAGRVYNWNASFDRHVNCDCSALPTTLGNADKYLLNSPEKLVKAGQITDLTKGQRERLADGADLSKVLNESRDRWRERMAADRRAAGPVDRLGRSRPQGWAGGGSNPPPVGTTIHDLMARLTDQVDAARAMQAAGIAAR